MKICPKCQSSNVEFKAGMSSGAAATIATIGSLTLALGGQILSIMAGRPASTASKCHSVISAQERTKKWTTSLEDHYVCHNCGHKW